MGYKKLDGWIKLCRLKSLVQKVSHSIYYNIFLSFIWLLKSDSLENIKFKRNSRDLKFFLVTKGLKKLMSSKRGTGYSLKKVDKNERGRKEGKWV